MDGRITGYNTANKTHLIGVHALKTKRAKFSNARIEFSKNNLYFCQKMTSLMKTTFGEYIRLLRNENELTLTQLAAKLNLDSANLSKIENGKREFDEKRLPKLAKIFKLNLTELRNEYVTDQIGKHIYETNCTKQLLQVAEEKAEYRRTLNKSLQTQ